MNVARPDRINIHRQNEFRLSVFLVVLSLLPRRPAVDTSFQNAVFVVAFQPLFASPRVFVHCFFRGCLRWSQALFGWEILGLGSSSKRCMVHFGDLLGMSVGS